MKHKYRYVVALLVLIVNVMAIHAWRTQKATQSTAPLDERAVSVSGLLRELGDRYDYFFTVEETWTNGEVMNRLEGQRVQRTAKGKAVWDELAELSRLIPDMTYKIDEANPKIIHIIDAGVAQQKGYALDSVIPNMDFTGTVFELVAELEKQGIKVSSRGGFDMHELSAMDFRTQVHVKGAQLSVRSALSDFLPLKGRVNRILWVASTKKGAEGVSFVRFPMGSLPPKGPAD